MTARTAPAEGKETLAYSIRELAESTSLGEQTIRDAIRDGNLVAKKQGQRKIVPADEAKRWVASLEDA